MDKKAWEKAILDTDKTRPNLYIMSHGNMPSAEV